RQHVRNEALVVAPDGVIGCPACRWAPMPVQHILSALAVPVPFNSFPEGIGACSQLLFMFIALLEVFPDANQRLRHKSGFHRGAALVILANRCRLAGGAIQPVWPRPMKPVRLFQITDCPFETIRAGFACDKASCYTYNDGHQPEAAAADGDNFLIILRVFAIHVNALTCESRGRLGTIPEILKGLPLHEREQGVVRQRGAGVGTLLLLRRRRSTSKNGEKRNMKKQSIDSHFGFLKEKSGKHFLRCLPEITYRILIIRVLFQNSTRPIDFYLRNRQ